MSVPRAKSLAVSIHDVSPWTRPAVEAMLADLSSEGVTASSLLVVPDHHRRGSLAAHPDFLDWLRILQNDGHEIVLHGFYHRRESRGGGVLQHLVTEHYTAGEGEFYDLSYAESRERMESGREMLRVAGLDVPGFIAPAWLLGNEAEQAARSLGFAYTTRLGGVLDLRSGAWTRSQSLVYSVRNVWRRQVSLAWNSFLASRLRRNPLMRLGLHPPDWEHRQIRTQALRLACGAVADRKVIRYRDWVGA